MNGRIARAFKEAYLFDDIAGMRAAMAEGAAVTPAHIREAVYADKLATVKFFVEDIKAFKPDEGALRYAFDNLAEKTAAYFMDRCGVRPTTDMVDKALRGRWDRAAALMLDHGAAPSPEARAQAARTYFADDPVMRRLARSPAR